MRSMRVGLAGHLLFAGLVKTLLPRDKTRGNRVKCLFAINRFIVVILCDGVIQSVCDRFAIFH